MVRALCCIYLHMYMYGTLWRVRHGLISGMAGSPGTEAQWPSLGPGAWRESLGIGLKVSDVGTGRALSLGDGGEPAVKPLVTAAGGRPTASDGTALP
jgi:hypothetical protein